MKHRNLAAVMAVLIASSSVRAQAPLLPDCTGISDVSGFDGTVISDFAGKLTAIRVASGLVNPSYVTAPPDGPSGPDPRLFIVEQPGRIRILDLPSGTLLPSPFLDIQAAVQDTGNEEGLLGLAFHPDYATPGAVNEGLFFVYYTNNSGNNQVSRFHVSADPDDADESTEEVVLVINHPTNSNHNGGQLAFGPDGYLYLAPGDGGSSCDPNGNAQNLNDLRGKILRLDVDAFPPYATTGNPFDGSTPGLDEIWAYGLRNPWRFSFDRGTGTLYVGDVGQSAKEEIDCQPPGSAGGGNYGWDLLEGSTCGTCGATQMQCNAITDTLPILEYDHTRDGFSCAVTGGYVYRGCRMSDLRGTYVYADYCSANVRTFRTGATCTVSPEINRTTDLDPPGTVAIASITSFGEDARGEIYICDRGGEIFKIVPELDIMEVSGVNAAPLAQSGGDLAWEDLQATSSHPVSAYRVYRADGDPAGPFVCVHQGSAAAWAGGDPQDPPLGALYSYVVTARNSAGQETRPGSRSDGAARDVDTASACP